MNDAIVFPGLVPTKYESVRNYLSVSDDAASLFNECSEALGYDLLSRYKFGRDMESEPFKIAFLVINLALIRSAKRSRELHPPILSGQSFGGFLAAVEAGSLSVIQMTQLVSRSGNVENDYFAQAREPTACIFFGRTPDETLERLTRSAIQQGGWAELSVRHDRGLRAVSGNAETIARLRSSIRSHGGIVFHTATHAEHCSRVQPLREILAKNVYQQFRFKDPNQPLLSEITGKLLTSGDSVARDLLDGWTHATNAETLYRGLEQNHVYRLFVPSAGASFRPDSSERFQRIGITPASIIKEQLWKR